LKHPSELALRNGLSHRLRPAGGLKLTCAVLCQRLLGRKTPGSEREKLAQGIYREAQAYTVNQLYLST
jgi:hypothetical protein